MTTEQNTTSENTEAVPYTMRSEDYDFVMRNDDEGTSHRKITKWGRTWGISLTRECALLNISPGDEVEVTIKVLHRSRYVPSEE